MVTPSWAFMVGNGDEKRGMLVDIGLVCVCVCVCVCVGGWLD